MLDGIVSPCEENFAVGDRDGFDALRGDALLVARLEADAGEDVAVVVDGVRDGAELGVSGKRRRDQREG
jgi:hypothetical protein